MCFIRIRINFLNQRRIFKLNGIIKVGLGSALGVTLRVSLDSVLVSFFSYNPYLVLALINLLGCFLVGALYTYMQVPQSEEISGRWYFWGVGFCGGFTTFASFVVLLYQGILDQSPVFTGIYSAFLILGGMLAFILGLLWSKNPRSSSRSEY